MAGETPTYPKRPAFFALKAVRAMVKTCVAQEHGQGVFSLLCVIATTEDARHYTSPVTYWNEQLAHVTGFANVKAMDRQRAKAVDAGWLVYIPGGNRVPGKYWVTIPPMFSTLDDSATDEGAFPIEDFGVRSPVQTSNSTNEVGNEPGMNRDRSGNRTGNEPGLNWAPFLPVPNPVPNPDTASAVSVAVATSKPKRGPFVPPTVEQVAEYVTEINAGIDPSRFVDHYAARGWVMSNGRKIVDWKACVRTWRKNDEDRRFGNANQTGVLATTGNKPVGGIAGHEQARQDTVNEALAGFLQRRRLREGNVGADDAEANSGIHGPAGGRLALRLEEVSGPGAESVGRGASSVRDAIPGVGRPIQALPAEDAAEGILPDAGR